MSDLYELLEERKPGGKKYTPEEYRWPRTKRCRIIVSIQRD